MELKALERALSQLPILRNDTASRDRLYIPSAANKDRRLTLLRRFFFRDDACTRQDQDLLKELDQQMHGSTNGQNKRPHAQITPAAATAATPNEQHRGVGSNAQYTASQIPASLPPHSNGFASLPNGFYTPSGNHISNPFLVPPPYNNLLPTPPVTAHRTPPSSSMPSSSTSKSSTKVKQEARQQTPLPAAAAPPPSNPIQPSTPQEAMLFDELRQMGFTDVHELLAAIRHFTTPSDDTSDNNAAAAAAPTLVNSEQVMMWIISQREEAEEAKKMDEARLRSESLRKEQAELQKRAAQERLDAAGLLELKELFLGSWILQDSKLPLDTWVTTIKNSLVELLNLEKQAIKFYGVKLPRGYFDQLCVRLEECSNQCKIKMEMKNECEILQAALYRLSEQQGGVPRIFLTTAANLDNHDSSDDDIVIIHNRTSNASEVIEIE